MRLLMHEPDRANHPRRGSLGDMHNDPVRTNPELYRVVLENDRVRVLEYRDRPGDRTIPHAHPDSVMVTLSSFRRRLSADDQTSVDVSLESGMTRWLDAQQHAGENIGDTDSHVLFVELKEERVAEAGCPATLGPIEP
jgi:beta-alanine degradation protein BauB